MKESEPDIFHYLITHTGFRDWVQRPTAESNYFWEKWMEEHPENLSDVKKAWEFIERMRFQKNQLSPDQLDGLLGRVISNDKPALRSIAKKSKEGPLGFGQWQKIAAILLIPAMAAVVTNGFVSEIEEGPAKVPTEWITLENPKGRKSKITLPDGTRVDLNYDSRQRFPKVFEAGFREVELTGEAFFEVVPNENMPLIVRTNTIESEVVGSSFNFRSYEGEQKTDISLVTGKVKVNQTNNGSAMEDIYLSPGEQLSYNRNSDETVVGTFDVERVTIWKGVILFKDAGFEEFIDQLEKWYGVDFQIYGNPPKKWKINGRLSK